MYDWACSSYNLVIASTIFPTYFEAIAADNKDISKTAVTFLGRQFETTSLYNYSVALAMFIVACMSPLLSSIKENAHFFYDIGQPCLCRNVLF